MATSKAIKTCGRLTSLPGRACNNKSNNKLEHATKGKDQGQQNMYLVVDSELKPGVGSEGSKTLRMGFLCFRGFLLHAGNIYE